MKLRKRHLLPSALAVIACGSHSATDAGPVDAGPLDAGPVDAGPLDAGPLDAGPTDAGPTDAGVCPHPDTGDAGTVRCHCELEVYFDGDAGWYECCDPDIGSPCPVCCYNPRDPDGGRLYYPDGGPPVCYC